MFNTTDSNSRSAAVLAGCLLMATACTVSEDSVVASPDSLTMPVEQSQLIEQLTHDPDFQEWAKASVDLTGFAMLQTSAMTATELADFAAEAAALQEVLATTSEPDAELLAQTTAITGLDRQAMQKLYEHSVALHEKFPWLADTDVALVGQAMQANSEVMGRLAEYLAARDYPSPPPEEESGDSGKGCEDECNDTYEKTANRAMAQWLFEGALCGAALAGGPVVFALCIAAAAAEATIELAAAERKRKDCIAICNGEKPANECYADTDCDHDEFCHKPAFGLGDNECRDEKSLGQVCSRDGKCKSGCCKYHFWTNPVSLVCRPADKCN